ncbi:hypothetical protein HanRHA438_Chr06g0268751 [Helianthus annuus]|uniref:Uncharacterized protein n=1 Tax=Helianthus annuus TaxID=4232 RepID=A0A251UJM8_HELAN|nr:hypothetical protein HanXRQr2_Chr11g0479831 [Helianthus annuus]KAJ0432700.1 hypothetical protein HanIR_Chr17g0862121 [Helianthus annuus]KAJ0447010.1 hypothetical protein HanHA89_Chr17g0700581 [Helianthus annuus]KAJ0476318.1 hypothetical protein HanHA300_Chr13g0476031 [Helianthus annuus]KAJ0497131.1 hypothetical protein HanHA89_Chr13g0508011 [Helianthus annuus]
MPKYSLRRLGLKCCINFVYVMLNNVVICFSCNVLTFILEMKFGLLNYCHK